VEVLGKQHRHTAMLQCNLAVMLGEGAAGAMGEAEALFQTVS
jgi:hypothetical protein